MMVILVDSTRSRSCPISSSSSIFATAGRYDQPVDSSHRQELGIAAGWPAAGSLSPPWRFANIKGRNVGRPDSRNRSWHLDPIWGQSSVCHQTHVQAEPRIDVRHKGIHRWEGSSTPSAALLPKKVCCGLHASERQKNAVLWSGRWLPPADGELITERLRARGTTVRCGRAFRRD